jgi:membrane complex biogenesis BtpA family protein
LALNQRINFPAAIRSITIARPMARAFRDLFQTDKPVIGMLHLPALPGAPGSAGTIDSIREHVRRDLDTLIAGGAHGVIIENYGDVPFFPTTVPSHVVAIMTALAADVRGQTDIPMGINVLRNDGRSALAIAHAVGAQFIRVNVLCGARVTDQGIISGIAHDLLRDRAMLRADVAILADVDVKHSAPIAPRPLVDEVGDTLERGLADALIVSGAGTGKRTDLSHLREVKGAAGAAPVLIGSGADPEAIPGYLPYCDGFIVGTWIKTRGVVDPAKVRQVVIAAEKTTN